MASSGIKIDRSIPSGVQSLKRQGAIYHAIGPVLPEVGAQPDFLQIYTFDTADIEGETARRLQVFPTLRPDVEAQLQAMLHDHNPYVQGFRQAAAAAGPNAREMTLTLVTETSVRGMHEPLHAGRYDAPTSYDIAAFIPDAGPLT